MLLEGLLAGCYTPWRVEERDVNRLIVRGDLKTRVKPKGLRKLIAEALASDPDASGVGRLQKKVIEVIEDALDAPDRRVRLQAAGFLLEQTEGPTTRVTAMMATVREGVRLEIVQGGGGEAPPEITDDAPPQLEESFHVEREEANGPA